MLLVLVCIKYVKSVATVRIVLRKRILPWVLKNATIREEYPRIINACNYYVILSTLSEERF